MKNTKNKIVKHFIILLSLLFIFLGLIFILMSEMKKSLLFYNLLGSLGKTLLPFGLVSLLFEYYFKYYWTNQITNTLDNHVSITSEKIGLRKIYKNRKEWPRLKLYEEASNIKYLAVSPGFPPPYEDDKMIKKVVELLKKGTSLSFLVCDPESPAATQYFTHAETDTTIEKYKELIKTSLKRLAIIDELNPGPGEFNFKIYSDTLPTMYMQIIDNKIFIEPYTFGTIASKNYMLQFEPSESSEQYEYLEKHFNELWESSFNFDQYKDKYPDSKWLNEFNNELEKISFENNKYLN